jgi:hypothetical protein
VWQLFALALALFAAGDDLRRRAARPRAPTAIYSDVVYLIAYPIMAVKLYQLARTRFRRDTTIDSGWSPSRHGLIWPGHHTRHRHRDRCHRGNHRLGRTRSWTSSCRRDARRVLLARWMAAAWLLFALVGDARR